MSGTAIGTRFTPPKHRNRVLKTSTDKTLALEKIHRLNFFYLDRYKEKSCSVFGRS